jgi:phage terminase large subunit-like protein
MEIPGQISAEIDNDGLWADELAAWKDAQAVWDQAMFGLRVGKRPRAIITTTPRPIPLLRALLKRDGQDVRVTRGSTYSNREHLPQSFLDQMEKQYAGTRLGRQELEAVLLDDNPGALWSHATVELSRLPVGASAMDCQRIVVGIDPAVSVGEDSDLTGIVVCGLDWRGDGVVLEDASGRYLPTEWASRAVGLYRKWNAERVVAEVNNGGAMVEATLRAIDRNVAFKAVHAAKGKYARAEPVSALYEQGRVHHVGLFPELEDEMTGYAPGVSGKSPDRMDALVWALTELMVTPARPQFVFG